MPCGRSGLEHKYYCLGVPDVRTHLVFDFLSNLDIPLDGQTALQVNAKDAKQLIRVYRNGWWLDLVHQVDEDQCSKQTGVPTKTIAALSAQYRKDWVKTGPDSHYRRDLIEQ